MLRCRSISGLLGTLLLGALGCPGFGDKEPTTGALEPPTYVESVRPLLAERCFSCHAGADREREEFRLDSCEDTGGVLGARSMRERMVEQVSTDAMPDEGDPLTVAEKALLSSWAASGGACEPGYTHVRPLLQRYCVACHGPGEPKDPNTPPGLRLDRCTTRDPLEGFGAHDSAALMEVWLTDPFNPMPPVGEEPRPTDAEVQRILLWIARDAPCLEDDAAPDAGPETP